MYPGREALLPGPGGGSKQVGKSPVTKVSGGAKTSGLKWMHTLMCVKWKREKVFLSSKMKCNQSLTDTNILSAKRKKKSRLNFAFNGLWENEVGEFLNHLDLSFLNPYWHEG